MSGSPFPSLGPRYTLRSRPVCGPYGRETARMHTGLQPQSAARFVQVRRARYHLFPTCVAGSALPRVARSGVTLPARTVLSAFLSVTLRESNSKCCGKLGLFMSRFAASIK